MDDLVGKDYWKNELISLQRKSAESIVEYCKAIHEYSMECDGVKGGSTFTKDMKDWLGVSSTQASKLKKIGEKSALLSRIRESLPASRESLSIISDMDDNLIQKAIREKIINPEATAKQIKDYKEQAEYYIEHKVQIEESQKKLEAAKEEEANIPSEELLDDFELLGVDDDGNEIWGTKGEGSLIEGSTKAVSSSEPKREDRGDLIDKLNTMLYQLSNDDIHRVMDFVIKLGLKQ